MTSSSDSSLAVSSHSTRRAAADADIEQLELDRNEVPSAGAPGANTVFSHRGLEPRVTSELRSHGGNDLAPGAPISVHSDDRVGLPDVISIASSIRHESSSHGPSEEGTGATEGNLGTQPNRPPRPEVDYTDHVPAAQPDPVLSGSSDGSLNRWNRRRTWSVQVMSRPTIRE